MQEEQDHPELLENIIWPNLSSLKSIPKLGILPREKGPLLTPVWEVSSISDLLISIETVYTN